ncbi:MAG: integrase family protein [Burkholderiales bacterium]
MRKPPPLLTPRIIADLRAGEECGDPEHPGLRVRRTDAARVFFYRYRARDGALREIKLGEFGPMTVAEARKALGRLKVDRERAIDPQMVLFTGCRSGEVVAALWLDIDLERAVWTIRETKNGEPHDVMLSRQAIDLLMVRRSLHEVFVFPSPMDGHHVAQKALGLAQYGARKAKAGKLCSDPIEIPWTVHDLRRTVATGLAKLGCPRVVQDRRAQSRR